MQCGQAEAVDCGPSWPWTRIVSEMRGNNVMICFLTDAGGHAGVAYFESNELAAAVEDYNRLADPLFDVVAPHTVVVGDMDTVVGKFAPELLEEAGKVEILNEH